MLKTVLLTNYHDFETKTNVTKEQIAAFLHTHLDRFRDTVSAISKAIDFALSKEDGKGGFIILAFDDEILVGVVVINDTGMKEYIPENILVYIAVHEEYRGRGIGAQIMNIALENCKGAVALHVEYDNPAKRLYERLGFVSKYAEMRYSRS